MRPSLDELIESIRWTFDTHVVPALPAGVVQSYARTLNVLLESAALRAQYEPIDMLDEIAELEAILAARAIAITGRAESPRTMADLQQRVSDLRGLVVGLMTDAPGEERADIVGYVRRQTEREGRWMPPLAMQRAF